MLYQKHDYYHIYYCQMKLIIIIIKILVILEKLTLKHVISIRPLRQFPPPFALTAQRFGAAPSFHNCWHRMRHCTAYMDFIRSEGTNWMYSCPNQQKELTVAWITKEKRDKLKPGNSQHIYSMFETLHQLVF